MLHLIHPRPFILEAASPVELERYREEIERLIQRSTAPGQPCPPVEELLAMTQQPPLSRGFVLLAHPKRGRLTGIFGVEESTSFGGLPVEHPIVRASSSERFPLPLLEANHGAENLHTFLRWLTESEWRADIVTFEAIAYAPTFRDLLKRYCSENHPLTTLVISPNTPAERLTVALSTIGSLILTGSRCLDRSRAVPLEEKKRARPIGRARATSGLTVPVRPSSVGIQDHS